MTDSDSSWFSLKRFAVALVAVPLGAVAGMELVPVVGSYLGILLGGVATGLAFEDRPLLECGLVAVLAGLGTTLVSKLIGNGIIGAIIGLFELNPQILLVSAVISFGVGALGAHFGTDLRDGLTEPVEEPDRGLDEL